MSTTRKPIDQELFDPSKNPLKRYGRQAMWDFMREHKRFYIKEVALYSSRDASTVRAYVKRLLAGGYLVEDGIIITKNLHKDYSHKAYKLVKNAGHIAPRLDKDGNKLVLANDNMWRTMKYLRFFTAEELAASASTSTLTVKVSAAEDYCKHLHKAGYLTVQRKPSTAGGKTRYAFLRSTGYHAPMVQRAKVVFDPNLCKVMYHEELDP